MAPCRTSSLLSEGGYMPTCFYKNNIVLLTLIVTALFLSSGARASILGFDVTQPNQSVPCTGTVVFLGAITNNSGSGLASTDMFFNFNSFDPSVITPMQ